MSKEVYVDLLLKKAEATLTKISDVLALRTQYAFDKDLFESPGAVPIRSDLDDSARARQLQIVSGEIKQPLTTIVDFSQKLKGQLDPKSEAWRQAQRIFEESRKLAVVVNAIQ